MLTIIIPVFNEINTIERILVEINKINFIQKQIILVDDFSTDGTRELIKSELYKKVDKVIFNEKNFGKGFSIKSAQKYIQGEYTIIQDADLEYSPKDYKNLLEPLLNQGLNVVYGSRVLGKKRYNQKNFTSIFRIFANHLLTIFSNLVNNQNLTDAHTCYKVFRSSIFKKLDLEEKGFAFCPEVTTKLSNLNYQIKEIPISYNGRNYEEGKKIKFKDAIEAILALLKYKFFKKSFNNQ